MVILAGYAMIIGELRHYRALAKRFGVNQEFEAMPMRMMITMTLPPMVTVVVGLVLYLSG